MDPGQKPPFTPFRIIGGTIISPEHESLSHLVRCTGLLEICKASLPHLDLDDDYLIALAKLIPHDSRTLSIDAVCLLAAFRAAWARRGMSILASYTAPAMVLDIPSRFENRSIGAQIRCHILRRHSL